MKASSLLAVVVSLLASGAAAVNYYSDMTTGKFTISYDGSHVRVCNDKAFTFADAHRNPANAQCDHNGPCQWVSNCASNCVFTSPITNINGRYCYSAPLAPATFGIGVSNDPSLSAIFALSGINQGFGVLANGQYAQFGAFHPE
ncbi:uncharacterized protein PFL1_05880 [Pseudozyma flocculosa PF-1]|uniref:Uncharacterized protein n=2 Tax=Pseudozyma flocculosa TaxID=84751 RepID=A0A5C3F5D8_9BASI|nr:uncharacterized protein PFL1_05880 [Pseudozyma flocculosa PF-1]EPQ26558.1 hypothetical protein PFL1_05880 [Pseudozyma flocculosa PF-1]SPO38451.1 uncharacterized protein PSFLO_03929 [Pseudozyma flocculosa]